MIGKLKLPCDGTTFYRALAGLIGKFQLCRLRIKGFSDCDLFRSAQSKLGVDARAMVEMLSDALGVPFLSEIPSFDSSLLPRGLSVRDLRETGMIPLFDGQHMVAVCGINRERIYRTHSVFASTPFYMTSPEAMNVALKSLEGELDPDAERLRPGSSFEAGLFQLLNYADASAADGVLLQPNETGLRYELRCQNVATSQGKIGSGISQKLYAYCGKVADSATPILISGRWLSFSRDSETEDILICIEGNGLASAPVVAETTEPKTLAPTRLVTESRSRRLLLVEDNRDFLRVLERFLQRSGFQVRSATNGRQALEVLQSGDFHPAALVTDLHMPVFDGFSLAEKAMTLTTIPVILLTSDDTVESELNALNRGVVAVIQKSRDPRLLVAHLNRICGDLEREAI